MRSFQLLAVGFWLSTIALGHGAEHSEGGTRAANAKAPAPQVDLRPQIKEWKLGPREQFSRGTCSVFTTVASIEFAEAKRTGKGERLSVEYLNWACNQLTHNRRDRGQFFHNLLSAFKRYGICPEKSFPYHRQFDAALAPSVAVQTEATELVAARFEIRWIKPNLGRPGFTEFQMNKTLAALDEGWPVAAGASHSRLLVGYSLDEQAPGGGTFLTMDSGLGRFDQVSFAFAKREINDAFYIVPKE